MRAVMSGINPKCQRGHSSSILVDTSGWCSSPTKSAGFQAIRLKSAIACPAHPPTSPAWVVRRLRAARGVRKLRRHSIAESHTGQRGVKNGGSQGRLRRRRVIEAVFVLVTDRLAGDRRARRDRSCGVRGASINSVRATSGLELVGRMLDEWLTPSG